MTPKDVGLASQLLHERRMVDIARWNAVGSLEVSFPLLVPADEQLQAAIEEFRLRKVAAIDARLRELGVET